MQKLLSDSYAKLQPYKAGLTTESIKKQFNLEHVYKFASNESPFPPSPLAIQAVQEAMLLGNRYPDYDALKIAIAEHCTLAPSNVLLGTGSINVLDILFQAFARPGKNVVFSSCSYFAYPLLAQKSSLEVKLAECGPALDHVAENLYQACDQDTAILVIDNPGNFSGAALLSEEILGLLQRVSPQTIVILDQAYVDFAEIAPFEITAQTLRDFPNLVVTRTFSKAYSLAALRVGYALADPTLIDWLNRGQQPFPVSGLANAAAIASLSDKEYSAEVIRQTKQGRAFLKKALTDLEIPCYESHSNFVLANFGEQATTIYQKLLSAGFITRQMNVYNRPDLIRISIGNEEENKLLVQKMKELLRA